MFNTLKYTKILEEVGVPREQAEAHIEIMADITEANFATKQDIRDLEHKLIQLEYRLTIKLGTIVTVALAAMTAIQKFL